jgi:tetratricopeptide (TPR) repeat protein
LSGLAAEIYESLGDVLEIIGKHDDAREAYRKAIANVGADENLCLARLNRNIGKTQRQTMEALQAFESAETILGSQHSERDSAWWHEWIQIQLDCMGELYWLALVERLNELTTKTQPIIEQYGSHTQRGKFFYMLMLYHLRLDRYMPSKETVNYAQIALAAIQGSNEPGEVTAVQFGTGFTYLWRGELDEAEGHLTAALQVARRRGDSLNQVLGLTYLTILYRKRKQVADVKRFNSEAIEAATAGNMLPYIGMGKANMAWLAWRENDYSTAREYARSALQVWQQQGQNSYAFQWAALWPLISIAVSRNEVSDAMECARALLAPTQQLLPSELSELIEEAKTYWQHGDVESTRERLHQAVKLAEEFGYL